MPGSGPERKWSRAHAQSPIVTEGDVPLGMRMHNWKLCNILPSDPIGIPHHSTANATWAVPYTTVVVRFVDSGEIVDLC